VSDISTRDDAEVDESTNDAEWLLPSEIAARYDVARRTIYYWITKGFVPVREVTQGGRRYYEVRRDALEQFMQVRVRELHSTEEEEASAEDDAS
jgi:predicted site-specific integrase-resolvase